MARDQGPGPMPSVCQPALKNTPPKSWRTPKEPTPPQPQLGGWEFDKQPPRELIRPAPPPPPPAEPRPPMAKTFVKCCTIPEGLMDHPPVGDGWVRTSALRDYGNFALLGSRERNSDGSIPLKKIGGSALPLTGTLAIGATAVGETAGGIATGVTTGVSVGFLIGLVSFLWPTQTGDSAMYTEDELRERTTARTRARLHIEEQPDGTLKGYAWYTAPNKRALRWETVPVIPFQPQGDAFVADFGNGANLTWTPAVDTSKTLGIPALEASPEMPAVWVYPPTETVDQILVNPVYPPDFKDAILIFPADSGVPPLYVVISEQLIKNKKQGQEFEDEIFKARQANSSETAREVTVKTQSGVRTRMDILTKDENGNVSCVECKSSETAPMTKNQKIAYPEIEESGAIVVGKGKPGFQGGTRIPPTKIEIVRPKTIE